MTGAAPAEVAAPPRPGVSARAPTFTSDARVTGVLLGLPMYGGQLFEGCLHGLLEAQEHFIRRGIPFSYQSIRNESLIQRARNRVVAEFLANDRASHLVFVDADIGFTAHGLLRLLAHDRPVIGGLYRKKNLKSRDWVMNAAPNDRCVAERDERTGAMRVDHIGTGFMALRRDAILRMVRAFPHLRYRVHPSEGDGAWTEHLYALFDCWIDPATGAYYSEDYGFCERWRALGGEIWADPGILLEHWGTACFAGDPLDDFVPGEG